MALWIAVAALIVVAAAAVLAPLFRSRAVRGVAESEIAIYSDQLGELERDVERGVLPESEAKAARAEIARRLLRASETGGGPNSASSPRYKAAAAVALIVLPLVSITTYLLLGEPDATDRPYSARIADIDPSDVYLVQTVVAGFFANPETFDPEFALGLVTAGVEANPEHPAAWESLAVILAVTQNSAQVLTAYDRYSELQPPESETAELFGIELARIVYLGGGIADGPVDALARRILALNPANRDAQIFQGLAMEERGENDAAEAAWESMLAEEPPGGTEWGDLARSRLAILRGETTIPEPPPATNELTPEQLVTINQMVDGLAERLAADPDDAEGWAQLITSYIVLERSDEARAALATARDFFTGNEGALALIEGAAAQLTEQE